MYTRCHVNYSIFDSLFSVNILSEGRREITFML